jgi:predicted esterase
MPSAMAALAQLDAYERAEGPFDAVLAFSQGAGLAAAFMMQRALAEPLRRPPFRCAVLVSCVWVYDPVAWAERGEVRTLHGSALGEVVAVPTVHVWGARDPRRAESEGMRGFCKAELATVFVHGGGHEVPGLGAKEAVSGTVKAIRRGITLATLAEAEQPVAV